MILIKSIYGEIYDSLKSICCFKVNQYKEIPRYRFFKKRKVKKELVGFLAAMCAAKIVDIKLKEIEWQNDSH